MGILRGVAVQYIRSMLDWKCRWRATSIVVSCCEIWLGNVLLGGFLLHLSKHRYLGIGKSGLLDNYRFFELIDLLYTIPGVTRRRCPSFPLGLGNKVPLPYHAFRNYREGQPYDISIHQP